MAVNFFEGGRRITILLQYAALVMGVVYIAFSSFDSTVRFETKNPKDPFRITYRRCAYDDGSQRLGYKIEFNDGDPREVEFCFRKMTNGVPYGIDYMNLPEVPGRGKPPRLEFYKLADTATDPALQEYMAKRVKAYVLQGGMSDTVKGSFLRARLNHYWDRAEEAIPFVLGFVFGIGIFSLVLGWIVRGFAGVPTGQDFRPKKDAS